MKRIVFRVSFLLGLCFFMSALSVDAQILNEEKKSGVYQKSSNKKQLINGKEIVVKKTNLQLLSPKSVTTSSSSLEAKEIEAKQKKATKPPKVSKYGRQESSEIKREENE